MKTLGVLLIFGLDWLYTKLISLFGVLLALCIIFCLVMMYKD